MNNILKNREYMLNRVNNLLLHPERIKNKQVNLTSENKQKIEALKNSHKGERCFIIGGAPSLKQIDLSLLNNEHTFTVNKGYKLKELGLKKSTYHVIIDRSLLKDDGVFDEIPVDFSETFFINGEIIFDKKYCNKIFLEILNSNMLIFQEDLEKPLMHIGTVIGQAIQIAYYMGFKEIYLIGVDINFNKKLGYAYEESEQEKERQKILSVNSEKVMLEGLENMTKFLESKNIKIFNASPSGNVDCMQRVEYDKIFHK